MSLWRHDFYPMLEPVDVADVYIDGLGSIEILGDNVRFTNFAYHLTQTDADRFAVSKLIVPLAVIEPTMAEVLAVMNSRPIPWTRVAASKTMGAH